MAKDFELISSFIGYRNKTDVTKQDPRALVSGSQNVIVVDGDRVASRPGFSLYGAANSALTPIESSIDWDTSTGTEMRLRAYDDELEFLYNDTWYRLADGFTSAVFRGASWWDNSEKIDVLLIVNGDSNIHMWSGGITTFASATSNTITKQGTTSWGEERFLTSGTRQVVIEGVTYTYTGGETSTTLTGVTPDPTSAGHTVGAVVHQALRTSANTPASASDNDIIAVLDNQVYVADTQQRTVYVSSNASYTSYSPSSPRVPGEGVILTLDSAPVGFAVQEGAMYITAGMDDWYQVVFTLSADLANETVTIDKLNSGPLQAARSQSLIGKIKNSIVYVSQEPTFDSLGRVENINTPQSLPLSDPIKTDFESYDFSGGGHIMYWRSKTYISIPSSGVVLIYDHQRGYWNAPQLMSISRFSIIGGHLYGHSSVVPETYKLFDESTYSDNGNPINAVAAFAYRSFSDRAAYKQFDEYYNEGYITSNTDLLLTLRYDYGGFTSVVEKTINTSNPKIIFDVLSDNSLGKNSLGKEPAGSALEALDDLSKFRVIKELSSVDFFEYQPEYSSNAQDARWEILCHGPNARRSTNDAVDIKE